MNIGNIGSSSYLYAARSLSGQQSTAEKSLSNTSVSQDQQGEKTVLSANGDLTEEEQKQVQELQQTDREVRSHEQAHKTVGGQYTGPISYETVQGPDGKQYAVSGEVPIDASPVPNNPEATVRKLQIVIRAALAPADPSPQDYAVARQAQRDLTIARAEARELKAQELEEKSAEKADEAENGQNTIATDENTAESTPNNALNNDSTQNQQNTAPNAEISLQIQRFSEANALPERIFESANLSISA